MKTRFVSYLRVSTAGQGESGLGLQAQREAVVRYVAVADGVIVAEYTEVESGTKDDRPQLAAALKHCRMASATLVIAKLDRLARNVHLLSCLLKSGAEFVACDNPTANHMTLYILMAVAEDEARRTRERTVAAMGALKARGVPLGVNARDRNGRRIGDLIPKETVLRNLDRARAAWTEQAGGAYADYRPILEEMQGRGLSTRAMAEELNGHGYLTRSGKPWNKTQVGRVLSMETSR